MREGASGSERTSCVKVEVVVPVINTVMFRTVSVDRRDLLIRKVGSSRLYKSHADKRPNLRTGFLFRWPILRVHIARLLHFAREDFV